jgi:hypothetical protein
MKRIIQIISLFFLIIIFSCEKESEEVSCTQKDLYEYLNNYPGSSISSDDLSNSYYEIWVQLFKDKNHISQEYFDDHIQIWRTSIDNWNSGASFRICYRVKFDWAIAYTCDQFIIKIDKENQSWPLLPLPRDTYLKLNEIKIAVENHAFSSDISFLSNNMKIEHNSFENALKFLTREAGVNTLCTSSIYIDEATGHLWIEAHAEYNNKYNECIYAKMDLKTLERDIKTGVCFIID